MGERILKDEEFLVDWEPGEFFWLNMNAIPEIRKDLTGDDWMFCTTLLPFVDAETCVIWKCGEFSKHAVKTIEEIAEITGYSSQQAYRHMNNLINKGLIKKMSVKNYSIFLVNPYILNSDNGVDSAVYDLFDDTKWAKLGQRIPERAKKYRNGKNIMNGTNLGWCVKNRISPASIKAVKEEPYGYTIVIYGCKVFYCRWADNAETTIDTFLGLPYKTYNSKNVSKKKLESNMCNFRELSGYMPYAEKIYYGDYLQNIITNKIGFV